MPKRFHTANTILDTQVITFGGCHSEYIHLNDLNIFELKDFIIDPQNNPITCIKVNVSCNVPSTRWGHGAVVNNSQLYVLGGRNDIDVNDIQCFDIKKKEWN